MVLSEFIDMPVHVRIQFEYSLYNGEIQENKIVRNFFRFEDKATAEEIVNGVEVGSQYAKEAEFAEAISYKDGLTEEDITTWKQGLKKGGSAGSKDNTPSAGFGKPKRSFAKK